MCQTLQTWRYVSAKVVLTIGLTSTVMYSRCYCCCDVAVSAAVRRNPVASKTSLKTMQVASAKWLYGARDREGGHKA